jgi:transcriptional antiterminator Rof (Rho-off)
MQTSLSSFLETKALKLEFERKHEAVEVQVASRVATLEFDKTGVLSGSSTSTLLGFVTCVVIADNR